jgi:hypothetical protein
VPRWPREDQAAFQPLPGHHLGGEAPEHLDRKAGCLQGLPHPGLRQAEGLFQVLGDLGKAPGQGLKVGAGDHVQKLGGHA